MKIELTEQQRLIAEIDLIKSIEYRQGNITVGGQFDTWETILEQKEKRLNEIKKRDNV